MRKKHTPGPWKAVRNAYFWQVVTPWPNQTFVEADETSPNVAYVWGDYEVEAEARARLMAAAPDLLNALTVLADACERMGVPAQAARAAIAKARGQA